MGTITTAMCNSFKQELLGGVHDLASVISFGNHDTDDISEGSSNLYFTNARADARVAASTAFEPAGTAVALAIALG